jgi:hypothetical protein
MNEAGVAILVCAGLFALLIGLLLGAVILRAACWMCSVKEPNVLPAMGIVLLTGLAGLPVSLGLRALFVSTAGGNGMDIVMPGAGMQIWTTVADLAGLPLQMLIAAGIYSVTIRGVSFGKGILIWLVQLLIAIIVGVVLGVFVLGVVLLLVIAARGHA